MGEENISRKAAIEAGKMAVEALNEQRALFEQQLQMTSQMDALIKKVTSQVEALRTSVELVDQKLDAFTSMGPKERLLWLTSGEIRQR